LDESWLAINVVERDLTGLLQPLDWGQGAPIGYLVVLKILTRLGGETEYALRLPSLLAGIALVVLLPALCRASFPRDAWLPAVATLLAGVNNNLGSYSVFAKPYAIDALAGVLVPLVALKAAETRWRGKTVVTAAVLFVLLPWLSFASVFVLGGVGAIGLAISCWRRQWSEAMRAGTVYALAAGSFLAHYWMFVAHNPFFQGAMQGPEFSHDVLNFKITSIETLLPWGEHLRVIFGVLPGVPDAMAGLAALVILIGAGAASSRLKLVGGWLFGPLVAVGVGAALHLYPLATRTLLFLIPELVVLLGLGLITLSRVRLSGTTGLAWVAGVLLFAPTVFWSSVRVVRPLAHEGLTDVIAEIEAMPGEPHHVALIDGASTPVFTFYNHARHLDRECFSRVVLTFDIDQSWEIQRTRLDGWPSGERTWLIVGAYPDRQPALDYLQRHGRLVKQIVHLDCAAYLFELSDR
jgi:hypothetical protein